MSGVNGSPVAPVSNKALLPRIMKNNEILLTAIYKTQISKKRKPRHWLCFKKLLKLQEQRISNHQSDSFSANVRIKAYFNSKMCICAAW